MKKVLLILLLSFSANAEMNMEPGFWQVDMSLMMNGKDMFAEIQKLMKTMPEAQRKMMMQQMKAQGMDLEAHKTTMCITKEMTKNPVEHLKGQKDCVHTFSEKTATRIKSTFKCKNGSNGEVDYVLLDKKSFNTTLKANEKGKVIDYKMTGKWLKAQCPPTAKKPNEK